MTTGLRDIDRHHWCHSDDLEAKHYQNTVATAVAALTSTSNASAALDTRYDTRHADLLYEVVRLRYEAGRPIIITTNKAFAEWNQVFDSAACIGTLIDRLCHRAEIIKIDGTSFRAKEAEDRTKRRRATRRSDPQTDR